MKRFLIPALLLCWLNLSAQKLRKDLSVEQYTSTSAYGYKIPVKKFSFDGYRLVRYNTSIHPSFFYLCFENEEYRKVLVCMNIDADTIVYAHKLKPGVKKTLGFRDYFITSDDEGVHVYNAETGTENWSTTRPIINIDETNNVAVDILGTAHDMYSGNEKWRRDIDISFGIDNLYTPDSNWMLFTANGLQCINTAKGTGWYYKINTGLDNAKGSKISPYGALTNVLMYQRKPNSLWYANSNILMYENNYYFAGIDEMICVSKSGELRWKVNLPGKSGMSFLEIKDSTLYLISRGYVLVNNMVSYYSTPFIAAFNKDNGEIYYNVPLEKKNVIIDYQIRDSVLLLVCENNLRVYDFENGKLRHTLRFDEYDPIFKRYEHAIGGINVFLDSTQNSKASLVNSYPHYFFLRDYNGNVLRINDALDTYDTIRRQDIYYKYYFDDGINITAAKKGGFIDKDGKRILNHATMPDEIVDNKLMFLEKDVIYVLDIKYTIK